MVRGGRIGRHLCFLCDELFSAARFRKDAEYDAFKREWYSSHLNALREPVHFDTDYTAKTAYRLTWLRSFHHPVAIRIEVDPTGSGTLFFKVADGAGGYDPGRLEISRRRALTTEELKDFERLFGEVEICDPEPETVTVTDGAVWIFEIRKEDDYCVADRRWPNGTKYADLGIRFLELAGFESSEDDPIY